MLQGYCCAGCDDDPSTMVFTWGFMALDVNATVTELDWSSSFVSIQRHNAMEEILTIDPIILFTGLYTEHQAINVTSMPFMCF